jgi:hypothetical protein
MDGICQRTLRASLVWQVFGRFLRPSEALRDTDPEESAPDCRISRTGTAITGCDAAAARSK